MYRIYSKVYIISYKTNWNYPWFLWLIPRYTANYYCNCLFRIPKVRILEDDEGGKDFELSDDPYDCVRLNVVNVPCIVTLSRIGHRHVVDATLQEEACSVASLLIAVTSKGILTCMRKIGKGSLDPESIFEMIETGKRVAKSLHTSLQSALNQEESLGKKRQKIGFLR
ncbi:hypothetical protein XENTR_v10016324 [Xenopus tropicalis]|nr:hypothetical protein XENTR_v10016324 [Xenopus tropicalis]